MTAALDLAQLLCTAFAVPPVRLLLLELGMVVAKLREAEDAGGRGGDRVEDRLARHAVRAQLQARRLRDVVSPVDDEGSGASPARRS